jgi:hypothetical protein
MNYSLPTLDAVGNDIMETTVNNVMLHHQQNQAFVTSEPVIVRPATDWETGQPQSQSPIHSMRESPNTT